MEELKLRLQTYKKALKSLDDLLNQDLTQLKKTLNPVLIDGLKNGQIQKFEYCVELTWKLIKKFLYHVDGIEAKSPKGSFKEFYTKSYIDDSKYQDLIMMIDDRNALSHIYSEDDFIEVYKKIPFYTQLMKNLIKVFENTIS